MLDNQKEIKQAKQLQINKQLYFYKFIKMQQLQNSPFAPFTDRINKDLFAWTLRKQQYEQLFKDYQNTLNFVQTQPTVSPIVLVDIGDGQNILSEGRRCDGNIILRMSDNLYVQYKMKQAEKVLKDLIELYRQKIKVAEIQIRKIMVSMRQVEDLIHQYSSLV